MNEDRIYPSMVIRSQAEAIELLEKENQQLKELIDKLKFAIKSNCIVYDDRYAEVCCDGDYLLGILKGEQNE